MTREQKATPVLQLFDIERGKGGSGDKQKVFVVKPRGAKRICALVVFLIVLVGCYLVNTQWELRIIKRDMIHEKGDDVVKDAIVQQKMVSLQTELESQLVSAIKERQDAETTAKRTSMMMEKAFTRNKKFVEFELDTVRESAATILSQFSDNDWFTEKLLELFADERSTDTDSEWLRNELKQVAQPFQEELLNVLEKIRQTFMELHTELEKDMKVLVDMQTSDQRKHGDQADKRLRGISDELRKSALQAAMANSAAQKVLEKGEYSDSEMNKMLDLFFQHARKDDSGSVDAKKFGSQAENLAEIDPAIKAKLQNIYAEFKSGKMPVVGVKSLLTPMIQQNEIPPPNNPDMDLMTYLEAILHTLPKQTTVDEMQTRRKAVIHRLFDIEKTWKEGGIDTLSMFQVVQKHIKDRMVPANWLLRKKTAIQNRMKAETRQWLSQQYESVGSGKKDKRQFYAELMDKYQEGMIPFDVMNRISKSLAQFNFRPAPPTPQDPRTAAVVKKMLANIPKKLAGEEKVMADDIGQHDDVGQHEETDQLELKDKDDGDKDQGEAELEEKEVLANSGEVDTSEKENPRRLEDSNSDETYRQKRKKHRNKRKNSNEDQLRRVELEKKALDDARRRKVKEEERKREEESEDIER